MTRIQRFTALTALVGSLLMSCAATAADKAQIQQAIAKGAGYIKQGLAQRSSAVKSLSYVALLKAGESPDSPLMAEAVAHVLSKTKSGTYTPTADQIYEAGVDATLLADLNGEKYRPQIQLIADYIVENQSPQGYWNYLPPRNEPARIGGDISVTHYACLGLWAAARAGIKIEPAVWVRVLNWMNTCNNPDGGYAYNPGVDIGEFHLDSTLNMTVNGVGIMCIAMLNLDPKRLPNFEKSSSSSTSSKSTATKDPKAPKEPAREAKKPAGALEAVDLDKNSESSETVKASSGSTGSIPDKSFARSRSALQWVSARFVTVNQASHAAYYYYSLERMGALANVKTLDGRDWYNECAEELLTRQNPDGSWTISSWGGAELDTCFAVLFLTRSTGKILRRTTTMEPPVGGGLLSGGRGLPDDLSELDANGNPKKKKGEKSSLDELLAALQNSDGSGLEETQTELIQMVQLGDKKQLVGQTDKLITLIAQPDPEVRRTAIWAIGRTGDLSLAKYAILGLDDPDLGVMTESHLALCWTARKPNAFKLALSPLADLPPDAPEDQKTAAVESWRRQALRLWGEWYLRNRPYADRGDEFETNLRNRLLQLK
jgi:hypothetical protein